jgi:hypothetical protein
VTAAIIVVLLTVGFPLLAWWGTVGFDLVVQLTVWPRLRRNLQRAVEVNGGRQAAS